MNLYNIFEGLTKKTVSEDFSGLMYGTANESNGLDGALADGNGVAAIQGTENDISPIGSGTYDDEYVTEDNPVEVDEAAMNPSAFAKAISGGTTKGVLVGFEFETLMPKATVLAWKNGPQETPDGYDPNSLDWIEGKTTSDLLDGINRTNRTYEKVFDDLFKYKNSVQTAIGHKGVWSHYRRWVDIKVREQLEAEAATGVSPIITALKELLKDRAFGNTIVNWMGGDEARRYGTDEEGNEIEVKAKPFILRILKDQTGVDFSGRVKKSEITPEVISKIKDAMQFCYRVTRNPVNGRCSQVSNAADGRKDAIYQTYVPGWSYRQAQTPETLNVFKQHFADFCTETMGTDNLKDLLKTKWAFKGRVNNTTDTLKEKLWYYVTPGAEEPASMNQYRRSSGGEYMDGAEFLKANLKDVFGDNMEIFRGYHQATKKLDRWYIEPDGSLRPNQGDYAAEVVSPPLKADAAMAALRTWYQKAQELNFYTNNSTGLHINVSIPDKIDVLKLAVFSGDQHVLKQFGREDNSYARSVIKSLKNQGSLPTIDSSTFKNAEKEMKELVTRISGDHFATVNFNGKYVSFRHAGGNYLGKAADIANTVGRFVRAMMIAADPEAYRDEYVGKLVKMMKTPEAPTSDKLAITDIREIAARGIPVQYVDFVTTVGSNPQEAVAAAEEWAKANYGSGRVNTKIIPDPSARERLAADRGFSANTKQHIETASPENFFRLEIFPTTRRNLESFVNRFSNYGTDRGSAFGMYNSNRDKHAVGVTAMQAVKQTDPGFVDVVKALRGEKSKPLPLPGTKAAPKAKAAKFASQQAEPETTTSNDTENARDQWTLNNGEMVRHYDPSQVNSERAFELAREMYSQYSRPVTISRDGTTYGHWPRQQQPQAAEYEFQDTDGNVRARAELRDDDTALEHAAEMASNRGQAIAVHLNDYLLGWGLPSGRVQRYTGGVRPEQDQPEQQDGYHVVDSSGRVIGQTHATEDDALEAAQALADMRRGTYYVNDPEGHRVGGARPDEDDSHTGPEDHDEPDVDNDQDSAPGRQFYRFMNSSNRNTVATGYYNTDQEAEAHAQRIANAVHGEILLLGVTATGPDRRLGTFQPQVSESRIFHADDKVNVVYQPQNGTGKLVVAKAVDHMMANKIISTYVHKSKMNPQRAPVRATDFVLNPAKGYVTAEDQDGGGVTSPGGSTVNDTTSPIHGFGEGKKKDKEADYGDDYQDMVKRVAAQEKRKRERQQQQKTTDDDVMESYMFQMKKAGYDIL